MIKKKKYLLTRKQLNFCSSYIKCSSKSEAYRESYDTESMKPETIHRKAVELFKNGKVTARIEELQNKIEKKELYTLEESIKKDLKLIQRYENALDVLEDITSSNEEVVVAKRT